MTFNEYWDNLVTWGIAEDNEIDLVISINGVGIDQLDKILYSRTGYRDWKQFLDSTMPNELKNNEG